jgi:hypothetical protein
VEVGKQQAPEERKKNSHIDSAVLGQVEQMLRVPEGRSSFVTASQAVPRSGTKDKGLRTVEKAFSRKRSSCPHASTIKTNKKDEPRGSSFLFLHLLFYFKLTRVVCAP